jgi:hypothetical protein
MCIHSLSERSATAFAIIVVAAHTALAQPSCEEVGRGTGGYTGPVIPISAPMTVRYGASMNASVTVTQTVMNMSLETQGSLSLAPTGGQWAVEARITSMATGGPSLRSVSPPLEIVRASTSDRGPFEQFHLDFSGLHAQGEREIPISGSWPHDMLKHVLIGTSPVLPSDGLVTGDVLISPERAVDTILSLVGSLYAGLALRQAIERNELWGRVAGFTWDRGRQAVVVEFGGSAEFAGPKGTLTSAQRGHGLLDVATGFWASSLVAVHFHVHTTDGTVRFCGVERRISGF